MTLALVVLATTGACTSAPPGLPKAAPPEEPVTIDVDLIAALESFDACDDLLHYLRDEGRKVVGPYGFGGRGGHPGPLRMGTTASGGDRAVAESAATTAAPSSGAPSGGSAVGGDFSGTNVQEEGVDEPDLVKTDGRRLVTIAGGHLRVVDVTTTSPRLVGSLRLGEDPHLRGELLLDGDRVIVLRPSDQVHTMPSPGRGSIEPYRPQPARTVITVIGIADPAAPRAVSEVVVDGSLVAARMVEGVARLVLRSGPPDLPFLYPSGSEASIGVATDANRKVVDESDLDDWLPGFTVDGGDERRLVDCRGVRRPEVFSGVGTLSVFTLDPDDPRPGPAATVVGAGDTVYASASSLYVTTTTWSPETPAATTDVHQFDISDRVRTAYLASGRVKGRLLNSFSMSEREDDLRVATTDDAAQESAVTVLRRKDGALVEVGHVGGLGKTERIYAVRFLGDRGYVVTFRQTDPLYVIDLADPTAPVVRGELKIPGYSAYLHPVGDHRLLGIGQDADEGGRVQGLQLSLFDVSDPGAPKRLATAGIAGAGSDAEADHHAFLWWPRTRLAMVPVHSYQDSGGGAVGFTVGDADIREVGRVRPVFGEPAQRSVVVGPRVLTLSDRGIVTSDLDTLTERDILEYR